MQLGLTKQQNTKRWAYYRLKQSAANVNLLLEPSDEEKILAYVRRVGSISNEECRALLNINLKQASRLLTALHKQGALNREGERRWAIYKMP